jgi:peptidyl-prolyl cis-trans isomerase B (cyclophilin B)
MKSILLSLAATCAAALPLAAQDAPTRVVLDVEAPVIAVGETFELNLFARFETAATVPATLLGGHALRTWVDGVESVRLAAEVEGAVQVAAGTEIRRRIPIDTAALWSDGALVGRSSLVLAWEGIADARVTVRLIQDQSGLDLDALDLSKTRVRLITNFGDMVVGFLPDKAPRHVRNFVRLSKDGFYDGTRFHRVIRGFMIQGGDPYTKKGSDGQVGTGDSGTRIDAEFNDVKHERGILSMARSADPNSASCQFFVMHGSQPRLDGQYSVFGKLESGFETLDAIADVPVLPTPRGEPSIPAEEVWLYAAVVEPVFR